MKSEIEIKDKLEDLELSLQLTLDRPPSTVKTTFELSFNEQIKLLKWVLNGKEEN
jgi:hypothetical protein